MLEMPGSAQWLAAATILFLAPGAAAQEPPQGPPKTPVLSEEVEVQLVLVDTVVLDKHGRTVPGLTADDFSVSVNGRPISVDTIDVSCPGGAMEDAASVSHPAERDLPQAPLAARTIVFAFDYMHLRWTNRARVLEDAQEMVRRGCSPGEKIMIAAITGGLRIEQPLTTDRNRVIDALHRMEYDVTLYGPEFEHGNEYRFFHAVEALLNVLEEIEGPKAMVLFSSLPVVRGEYDIEFATIAALATMSRTAIYPVHTKGLEPRTSCGGLLRQPVGGPPMLARLATETGGRFTYNTNDMTLGYARAQRDLACRYVLGFYDRLDERHLRRMRIRVNRRGLRAHAPQSYRFREKAAMSESRIRSAFIAPEMFATGQLRAHAFPLRPRKSQRWVVVLVVSFPVTSGEIEGDRALFDFGAVVMENQIIRHKFNRRIAIQSADLREHRERQVTFVEFADLKPGQYALRAVLKGLTEDSLDAAQVQIVVPKVPKGDLLLVPTMLGRRAEGNIVVAGNVTRTGNPVEDRVGTPVSFEPLLVQEVEFAEEFLALTRACTRNPAAMADGVINRNVTADEAGARNRDLPEEELLLRERVGKVRCHTLLDELPPAFLDPGRYVFETILESTQKPTDDTHLRFAVTEKEGPFAD